MRTFALVLAVSASAVRLRGGAVEVAASSVASPIARPALRLRGGVVEQSKTGKLWVTSTFTRDHVRFMVELIHYLGAYVGPRALSPQIIESVMVTANSVNTCPYCTGLHGQLARMSGTVVDEKAPEVVFATTFAENSGRGASLRAAFATLESKIGKGKALSVRALCWALLWGKTTGNTINAVRGKLISLRWWTISPFELLVFLFYGPLFLVIGILNAMLTTSPEIPAWASAALGAVLWLPQALHLFVAGLVSLALRLLAAPLVGLSL
jgi:AhpD family alkylhydroperoxidase